jgi:hypothetical protein
MAAMKLAVQPAPTYYQHSIALATSNHSLYPKPLQAIGKGLTLVLTAIGKFAANLQLSGGKTV